MNWKFWQKDKNQAEEGKDSFWQRLWQDKTRLAYLAVGIVALGLVVPLYQLYTLDRSNAVVTVGMIASVAGGSFLIYRGWRASRGTETVIAGQNKMVGPANSLNFYVSKDEDTGKILPEKLAFELVNKKGEVVTDLASLEKGEQPKGQPWQCLNDGCWYFLNTFDLDKKALLPFILPDSQYFDPAEFANVITMPAHKKLFEQRQSLFQKLAPGLMLIGFIASGFFCLIMGG